MDFNDVDHVNKNKEILTFLATMFLKKACLCIESFYFIFPPLDRKFPMRAGSVAEFTKSLIH